MEMYRMKRLLNFLETRTLLIQQKITEKAACMQITHRKLQFQSLEKEMKKSFITIQQ